MFAKIQRIHFVGIGGIGMSGIAEVLLNLGYKISGSDLKNSSVTQRLASLGAVVFEGHAAGNISGAEVVVTSSAVVSENPEVVEAHKLHIPVIPRAEMLAELMRLKYGIAVAGMHGKTTTTSMIAAVLAAGGLDPTVVVGGRVDALGSNARIGKSEYMVAEADESDRSFLKLSPVLSVVTNIDREHMDCYRNMRDVKKAFLDFMDRVPFYGVVVVCNDDAPLRKLFPQIRRRTVTYGTRRGSDFHIKLGKSTFESTECQPTSHFHVTYAERDLGEFRLQVPGVHNVLNATAAIAVGIGLDIKADHIRAALENFRGVDRRFQLRGKAGGVSVIDDYGHHPTEIRATLAAARQCGFGKIHVIFQPHRYTRTRDLLDEFATAFEDADSLVVLDIYAASEAPIEGITSEALVRQISEKGKPVTAYAGSFADGVARVAAAAHPGDMILTLGAGSVSQLGPMILAKLQEKRGDFVAHSICGFGTLSFFARPLTKQFLSDNDFFFGPSNRTKGNAMESDKLVYWMTLAILAAATVSGLATGHQGWGDRLANRSLATIAEASAMASNYAGIADLVLGRGEDSEDPSLALVNIPNDVQTEIQPRLACAERILVKRQAQLARLQALKVQLRAVDRVPRAIVWPNPRIVVEVPQLPEMSQ